MFIASDEIVSAIRLQIQYDTTDSDRRMRFVLEMNILVLDMGAFCVGGDEHFCPGDKHIENMHSNFNHTHSQLPATSKQNLCLAHLRKRMLSHWRVPKVM